MKKNSLTQKIYYSLLFPTLVTGLVMTIATFSDSIIVGNFLGEEALSAITFTLPIFMLINTLIAMITIGGAVVVSTENGKGNRELADKYFSMTLVTTVLVGVMLTALCLTFMDSLVYLLGARGEISGLVKEYATVIVAAIVLFLLSECLSIFARNDGRAALVLAAQSVFIVANIVLNIIFVGFAATGISGAAWAMVIAQTSCLLIIATHFFSAKNTRRFRPGFDPAAVALIIKTGGGTAANYVYKAVSMLAFNNLIMSIAGQDGIVVYTIVFNVSVLVVAVFESVSQTLQPIISTYFGERNNPGIREAIALATKNVLGICLIFIVALEIFPQFVAQIFGVTDPAVVIRANEGIRIYSISIVFACFTAIASYYYQFVQQPGITFVLTAVKGIVILLPCAFLLASFWGLNGIWLSFAVTEALSMAICLLLAKRNSAKTAGRLSSVLLLDKQSDDEILVLSIKAEQDELMQALDQAEEFLTTHRVDAARIGKIRLSMEELGLNIVKHNQEKADKYMEIQLSLGDELELIIRDNGKNFDPTQWEKLEGDQFSGLGLMLVKSASNAFEYIPTIGCNRVMLKY